MPGMGHDAKWWREYEALRSRGYSKSSAARITNSSQSKGKKKPHGRSTAPGNRKRRKR